MVTLYFTRQFTGGLLKGLHHTDSMRFVSIDLAAQFVKTGRKGIRKPLFGGSPYKIVDASFQEYRR